MLGRMREHVNNSASTPPRDSLARRLAMSMVRITGMLVFLFVTGCYLVAQPTVKSNSTSAVSADAARLRVDVEMLSETFHPRDWKNEGNLDRCADYIAKEFEKAGAVVEFQEYKAARHRFFGPPELLAARHSGPDGDQYRVLSQHRLSHASGYGGPSGFPAHGHGGGGRL